jgi:hypothetical protein
MLQSDKYFLTKIKMEISILVAKMAALVYLSVGIGALSGKVNVKELFDSFSKSPGLTYLGGFVALIAGVALVQYHNFWVNDWTVLVTILGWLAVIKGVTLIAFPQVMPKFKPVFKNVQLFGFLAIAIGLLFGYFGFVA